jgi:hypothetical protein
MCLPTKIPLREICGILKASGWIKDEDWGTLWGLQLAGRVCGRGFVCSSQPPRRLQKRYLPRVAAALIVTGLASAAQAQSVDWLLNIDDAVDPVSAGAAIE